MKRILIQNARLVSEGRITEGDLLIHDGRIERIDSSISSEGCQVIDAAGTFLLPGIIDDQVHFREPGLTYKGDIYSESRAAVAGGITSYMEQPNTDPQTITLERLEAKFEMARGRSFANYSFLLGGTNNNLEELKKLDPRACSGIKLFLGSSTGNMLVDDEDVLEKIFRNTGMIISAHCEDEHTIRQNLAAYQEQYGDAITPEMHPYIRSEEACYLSSSRAIALARKTGARLHVFHLSTARETALFQNDIPLEKKTITGEACIHHLWFSEADYKEKGNLIKWNPAIKKASDREGLWQAVLDDRIDVIATDHAPHSLQEKQRPYSGAPSGGPLVQHALPAMFEKVFDGIIPIEKLVSKMCHNPAILFQVAGRGFLREGYFADLVIVDPQQPWQVNPDNIHYKCGWSPFMGQRFRAAVTHTFVNGHLAYESGRLSETPMGTRLTFNRKL